MTTLGDIIRPEAWRTALEKYGAATTMTVAVYESSGALMLGPVHPTELFDAATGHDGVTPMFAECARHCLAGDSAPVIVDEDGVAVIGVPLAVAGEALGAVVAGYALTAFPEEATVRRFTQRHGLPVAAVWRTTRRQAPLTRSRLHVHAELLGVLTETLLGENLKAAQHREAARRLAEALRARDQFLAMLAHELRNPLGPIRIAMQVMTRSDASTVSRQHAREIVDRQIMHLARLLDDLFDVARVTSGKVDLRKAPIEVATAVANALDVSRTLLDERRHTLSVSLPDEPVVIEADPVRLEQIIGNLVNNAARYTPAGGHIAVTVTRDGGDVVLRVRDNGIGMPPDVMARVFDLFTQGDRSLARSEGGLGIGLTIVRNLVELHGGTVAAASEGPGRGSEFTVRLPAGAGHATSAVPPHDGASSPRLRILVVEDNSDGREMLRTMLEVDGHEVYVAADGVDGVETARVVRPDAAFIDIGLPGLDGYEIAKRLRRERGQAIRLIALTGYGQSEDRRRSREAGFDLHLVKPVAPELVRRALVARLDTLRASA
jgi:signal transduction histidine kinase/ActR/RegA family two-component response regulator